MHHSSPSHAGRHGDLHYLELTELAARIKAKEVSPTQIAQAQLERIAAIDGGLCSFSLVMADVAMAQAETAEREIASGHYRGPLHGVPIAVKDLCWTEGFETAAGMSVHKGFRPTEDATVVRRLRDAGAVLLGRLQLTEGAYSDHHPSITPPTNPWNAAYWPGMSSSGSGVATAAGLCFGSLGTDTGGSIRFPSAANGLTGLKPSWGRVSRHGVFELAASLDHVGTMARSAVDAGVMLQAIAGRDGKDHSAVLDDVPDCLAAACLGARGLRIGIDPAWNADGVDAATGSVIAETAAVFKTLGARIVEVRFPDVSQTIEDWFPICAVEAAVAHRATYPLRRDEYGAVLASVLEHGRALAGVDYQQMLLRRMMLRGRVAELFKRIDLLLLPVHPFSPPTVETMRTLGEQPGRVADLLRFTCPFNMTGHPTITLPGGLTAHGLPVAFQLAGGFLREEALVQAGAAYQSVTDWHRHRPPL